MSSLRNASLRLLQLSVFVLFIATVFSTEEYSSTQSHSLPASAPHTSTDHYNTPPPSTAPAVPPTLPTIKSPPHPPSTPPAKPPSYPPLTPRNFVAVQGVVYCKSCKYVGVDTLTGAAPLSGAVVKLQCNNTKYHLEEQATTDKNGFFFFMPKKVTTSGSHKCKVFLVSSPLSICKVPTNLNNGAAGATLKATKPPVTTGDKKLPYKLFTVGPFAFEPLKKLPCN
ncbi:pistil-specific extensin-like protein [Dorcoceras hygrometricum]|uniref:Pistil-specific extensin-like protein n=1 Tax=Dorcoceras hygrometricum TaxID=472368 RepID=A0A2Z7D1Y4_9LAMI|nr:pistil-specific extensin-like protein [Dorcoceras hygrometricum]